MFRLNFDKNKKLLLFCSSYIFKYTFVYLIIFSHYSLSLPPISPRFLHFTVQIQKEWLTDQNIRILAVFENLNKEKPKNWQMAVQLFGQNKNQKIPFITLLNITKGDKEKNINSENMPPCLIDNKLEENIEIEVELSRFFLYIRAKNAEKYILPEALLDSSELRVFFVRILYNNNKNVSKEREGNVCQLKSELDYKETSRYFLPSTTPHPIQLPTSPTTTSTSTTTTKPLPPLPVDIFSNSILVNEHLEEEDLNYPTKGPYKRTRIKLPRRSTKAAQSYLSANHYVQKSRNYGQQQPRRMFPPPLQTPSWPVEGNNNNQVTSTTPAYIDIIRDRQLYEEVQRSKTMEINSRWSVTFLLFVVLISVLISISATFALIMFVLLQCRPKTKKTLLISHSS